MDRFRQKDAQVNRINIDMLGFISHESIKFALTIGQPTEKTVADGMPTAPVHFSALICKGLTV